MAVFFWITIWQFASMYLGQEILLASPVCVGILVKNSGNPDSTCNCGGQIYTCGVFYHFVPDMDTVQKSVSFYFFSYGSACDIYEYP